MYHHTEIHRTATEFWYLKNWAGSKETLADKAFQRWITRFNHRRFQLQRVQRCLCLIMVCQLNISPNVILLYDTERTNFTHLPPSAINFESTHPVRQTEHALSPSARSSYFAGSDSNAYSSAWTKYSSIVEWSVI